MTHESILRLIIIDDSLNNAEVCNSTLRSMGYAVKSTRVEELDGLKSALEKTEYDLLLHCIDANVSSLSETRNLLSSCQQEIPIIALTEPGNPKQLSAAAVMNDGASDLVIKTDQQHLRLVVSRELAHIRQTRELKRIQAAYQESEKRCQALMNSSRDAIAYVHDGMHVYVNEAYLELFGFNQFEELQGTPIMDMVAPEGQQKLKEFLRHHSKNKKVKGNLETQLLHSNQTAFSGEMEFSPATVDGEACTQIVIRDHSDDKDVERRLIQLSRTDPLTGLYNRQYLMQLLAEEADKAAKGNYRSAILQISLDDFSKIKKSCGIVGSDQFITEIAKLLRSASDAQDLLFHFEGPVFSILSQRNHEQELSSYAQQILEQVEKHICNIGGHSTSTSSSIGICLIDESTKAANDMLSRADRALGLANQNGSSNFAIYQPKEGEQTQKQMDTVWSKRIREALTHDYFRLLYQPIVALEGDQTERYEVDLHILDADGNSLDQEEFLGAAERTGMSRGIDRWMVKNALQRLSKKHSSGRNTVFFIKLTPNALQDLDLFRWIYDNIKKMHLSPDSLVFEIEEEAVHTHLKQARAFATALHKLHCRMAVTNFGRGIKPFQLFKHVPVDYVKIDTALMEDISTNAESQEAVRTIMQEAKQKNVASIAPCVEDANSLTILWGMSVNFIQGGFLQDATEQPDYDFTAMTA